MIHTPVQFFNITGPNCIQSTGLFNTNSCIMRVAHFTPLPHGVCSSFSILRADGFWRIGPEAGEIFCLLRKRVAFEAEQMQPPATGWEYIVGEDMSWQSDPTMECSRELTPFCAGVSIGSSWLN